MSQFPPPGPDWAAQQPGFGDPGSLRMSGMAIASLVCGILSIVTCCTMLPGMLGIAFGASALPPINRREARGKGLAVSGIVLSIVGLVIGSVVWVVTLNMPDPTPIPGKQVSAADRELLGSLGVLADEEEIVLLYATGMWSLEEGCIVLTDGRLVVFGGADDIDAVPLSEIRAIEFTPVEDWFEDSQFVVETEDGELIVFEVTTMTGGDKQFHRLLKRSVDQAREAAGKPAAATELSATGD